VPEHSNHTEGNKRSFLKSVIRWTIGIGFVALLAIQFVPVDRSNPPVEEDIPTTTEVKAVLRRACYDCHSNETVWPWYAYVAPASWLVARDVHEGREHLNFSTWKSYDAQKQVKLMHESWEEVEEGDMPLWFYTPMHRDARMSKDDHVLLQNWALDSQLQNEPPNDD
jgi:hypothetical protein